MAVELVKGDLPLAWLQQAQKEQFVAIDIETTGLEIHTDTIALVQIHVPTMGTVMIQGLAQYPTKLLSLLEAKVTKVLHYAQFDLSFFMRDFPILRPRRIADTYIAANVLDPKKQQFERHSLQVLVQKVFGYLIDKSIRTSQWDVDTLTDEQIQYAEDDVRYLIPLLNHLEGRITPQDLPVLLSRYQQIPHDVMLSLKG